MKVRGYTIAPKANLREADLSEADLSGADLRGANLRWANLYGADLRGADLRGADLRGANLREADLRGANLREADLFGANLREADLFGAILPDSLIFFGYSPQGYSRIVFIEPEGLRIVMGCRTFSSFGEARKHFTDPEYRGGSVGKVNETLAALAYAETVTNMKGMEFYGRRYRND